MSDSTHKQTSSHGHAMVQVRCLFRCASIRTSPFGGRGQMAAASVRWRRLSVSDEELNLDLTLGSGQAFLWRRDTSTHSWTGPIKDK